MARYPSDRKRETHDRIVAEAARLFRADGYRGSGVDAVMAAAGLTAGGFYAHFDGKDALLAEAVEHGFADAAAALAPADDDGSLAAWVDAYVSRAHRDDPACGCPLPTLAGEMPRQSPAVRAAFTATLKRQLAALARRSRAATSAAQADSAIRVLAAAAGAMLLARAVNDPALSDRILAVVRKSLHATDASPRGRSARTEPGRVGPDGRRYAAVRVSRG